MSSSAPERHPCLGTLPEQLGYVQCTFCGTILLVSVPSCARGLQPRTAAVQCGKCASVLSVTLPPVVVELQLQQEEPGVDPPPRESEDEISSGEDRDLEAEAEAENVVFPAVNKPPVRRQRTPTAYNCFIKEEIRRIKTRDPSISHKEAFSAASKNWAHFPRIQQKGS